MFCAWQKARRNRLFIKKITPSGVTLLELLITLALIGILALLSVPLYTEHFIHERRLEAKTALEKTALQLEDYFLTHNTYQAVSLSLLNLPEWVANNHYHLKLENEDYFYTISAIPVKEDDPTCGTLTLNATGEKGITGYGTLTDCW